MPDNTKSRDGRDRKRVAGGQDWEVSYMKEKYNVTGQQVAGAIRAVGNNRKKVEAYLESKSAR
jgi:hypothetical protein